ncbi:hypothetical protein C2E23DRAFT_887610 [Lenzites betulinus]|nr:hypothetical protein C2E23DRAFT_887610 [Lenzites betulinus]
MGKGKGKERDLKISKDDTDSSDISEPGDGPKSKKARLTGTSPSARAAQQSSSKKNSSASPGDPRSRSRTPFKNPFDSKGSKHVESTLGRLAAASAGSSRIAGGRDREVEGSQRAVDYSGGGTAPLMSAKRIGDQLVEFRTRLETMANTMDSYDTDVESAKGQLTSALAELDEVGEAVRKVIFRTADLESTIESLEDRLVLLERQLRAVMDRPEVIANGEDDPEAAPMPDDAKPKPKKGRRDNALQDAIRTCLFSLMGITSKNPLPEPMQLEGTWWEAVYNGSGNNITSESLLRPHWSRPWANNEAGWSLKVAIRIQRRGTEYTTALSQEHLASLSRERITDALRVVFLSMAKRWKMENGGEGAAAKKERNLQAKSKARKKQKALARALMRAKVVDAQSEVHNYLFQWQYQSSDDSEFEEFLPAAKRTVDPETDDEEPNSLAAAPLKRKVWMSHSPGWRLDETNAMLDEIDVWVRKDRERERVGQGNTYRPRQRGSARLWKETCLPSLVRSKGAVLIPRVKVHSAWLRSKHGGPFYSSKFMRFDGDDDNEIENADEYLDEGAGYDGEEEDAMAGGAEDEARVGDEGIERVEEEGIEQFADEGEGQERQLAVSNGLGRSREASAELEYA